MCLYWGKTERCSNIHAGVCRAFQMPGIRQSGHGARADECPLWGVKRTSRFRGVTSPDDPKRRPNRQVNARLGWTRANSPRLNPANSVLCDQAQDCWGSHAIRSVETGEFITLLGGAAAFATWPLAALIRVTARLTFQRWLNISESSRTAALWIRAVLQQASSGGLKSALNQPAAMSALGGKAAMGSVTTFDHE
jgi:hypothetical protein